MSSPVIRFLAERPEHVDTLAAWHHAEWQNVMPDWTLAEARAELQAHATCRTRPTTLLLLDGELLLGSVSLIDEDEPTLSGYGEPWLASLYVREAARGRGHGARLVQALVAHAASLGVSRLYLFTPGQREFYARLGWQLDATVALRGRTVDLMSCHPLAGHDD